MAAHRQTRDSALRPVLALVSALLGWSASAAPALAASAHATKHTLGAPSVFIVFALMLAAVAVWHRRALLVAMTGLALIIAYRAVLDRLGFGWVGHELAHEWVTLANLLLLLLGFELLSNQFEQSRLPDRLRDHLPMGWTSGLVLLALVFVLSGFLDNIAAVVIGGVIARHVYDDKVSVGFLAALVAAANAGGAGSVIGDTTTTLMWLHGISPLEVLPAYLPSVAAFCVFGILGAMAQHRHHPAQPPAGPSAPLQPGRILIVAIILLSAVAANLAASTLAQGEETAPWLGLALWGAILVTSPFAQPDWRLLRPAFKGAMFLLALVAAATLMPIEGLPPPSWQSSFGLGVLSAVFDNIPLTALALRQGGHDWAMLAFAVGFGGSMVWFGSSAGVALTNLYPQGRSVLAWIRQGWFVPVGYVLGFFVFLGIRLLTA